MAHEGAVGTAVDLTTLTLPELSDPVRTAGVDLDQILAEVSTRLGVAGTQIEISRLNAITTSLVARLPHVVGGGGQTAVTLPTTLSVLQQLPVITSPISAPSFEAVRERMSRLKSRGVRLLRALKQRMWFGLISMLYVMGLDRKMIILSWRESIMLS